MSLPLLALLLPLCRATQLGLYTSFPSPIPLPSLPSLKLEDLTNFIGPKPHPEEDYQEPYPSAEPHDFEPFSSQPYQEPVQSQAYQAEAHQSEPYQEASYQELDQDPFGYQPYPEQPYPEQPYPEQPYPEQPYPEQPYPDYYYPTSGQQDDLAATSAVVYTGDLVSLGSGSTCLVSPGAHGRPDLLGRAPLLAGRARQHLHHRRLALRPQVWPTPRLAVELLDIQY